MSALLTDITAYATHLGAIRIQASMLNFKGKQATFENLICIILESKML
jgi:hypothetical protein